MIDTIDDPLPGPELSLASVLLPRLRTSGPAGVELVERLLQADVDAWLCPSGCGETDPVVGLFEPDGGLVLYCAQCNRAPLERAGYKVPS